MDEDALERLTANVAEAGVVQSVLVRPSGRDRYTLVAGHRRLTAARKGGVKTIPAVIRDVSRAEAIRDSLLENMHHEELNDLDQARGVQALAEEWDLRTNAEIADKLGLKAARVGLLRRIAEAARRGSRSTSAAAACRRRPSSGCEPSLQCRRGSPSASASTPSARRSTRSTSSATSTRSSLSTAGARFADAPTMIRTDKVEFKRAVADKAGSAPS